MQNTKLFPYSGSKYKYQTQLQNVVDKLKVKNVDTYIEAFAGSLGSFFHIVNKINAKNIIINDVNPKITNIYQQIKCNPAQVIKALTNLEEHFQALLPKCIKPGLVPKELRAHMSDARDFYIWMRDYVNEAPHTANHAAAMIFVLNHNFNGLYSESKKGKMNISFNWNSRCVDYKSKVEIIQYMHKFFVEKNVQITTMDVFDLLALHNDHSTFIYLDPPYIDNTITYVSNGFDISLPNQMKLLYVTLKYKHVMYSNHHNNAFVGFFDHHLNFYRSNKISSSKDETKGQELMAYKTNPKPITANNKTYKRKKTKSS